MSVWGPSGRRLVSTSRWVVRCGVYLASCVALAPHLAQARNVEPGEIRVEAGLGPGFNLGGSRLAATGEYLLLDASGLYYFGSAVGIVGEFGVGISGGTIPLRWRAGA